MKFLRLLLTILTITSTICFSQPSKEANKKKLGEEKYYEVYHFYLANLEVIQMDTIYNLPPSKLEINKLKIFSRLMERARTAFIEKRFSDCFLILKSAESGGIVSKEFYLLIGIVTYYSKDVTIGRKYLERGYEKLKCSECKEALKMCY